MISVVLTARDAEDTLAEAVESCLGQTEESIELVLVDNGSTDETGQLIADLALADGRVRIFSCAGTHVEAHTMGIREARGEFVARMDADDISHPDRFARQVALLREDETLSGCTCGVRVKSRGKPVGDGFVKYVDWLNGLLSPEDVANERFIESPVVHPASMVRREALLDVGGYREVEWAEDYDLWLRLLGAGHRIGMVPEVLFDWYDSESRITRTQERYSMDNFLRAKAHYLAKLGRRFEICGAGPIGKRVGRLLLEEGVDVDAFYEVNPRRIGESIAGVPVRDQVEMKRRDDVILLAAVGLDGARDLIRGLARAENFDEGVDFFAVA